MSDTRNPESDDHDRADLRPPESADAVLSTGDASAAGARRRAAAVRDALHRLARNLEETDIALAAYALRLDPSPEGEDRAAPSPT